MTQKSSNKGSKPNGERQHQFNQQPRQVPNTSGQQKKQKKQNHNQQNNQQGKQRSQQQGRNQQQQQRNQTQNNPQQGQQRGQQQGQQNQQQQQQQRNQNNQHQGQQSSKPKKNHQKQQQNKIPQTVGRKHVDFDPDDELDLDMSSPVVSQPTVTVEPVSGDEEWRSRMQSFFPAQLFDPTYNFPRKPTVEPVRAGPKHHRYVCLFPMRSRTKHA
ncbi:hypothetical protein QBC38DRAFT_482291 [Podospora fimiseda]|uniref:Uncharacterized protein n=1 Tax=Podospora fimiseda TaxID=252190 RepID=A0AAN7GWA8_9PEZI|nr:hypothetical protein QBC38DRAFT_482291 [Podospora fimiseda]